MPGEVERHLVRRLEEELVRLEAPVARVLERVARLDAEKRLVAVGVGGVEIVDVAGGDQRQSASVPPARPAAARAPAARADRRSGARRRRCRRRRPGRADRARASRVGRPAFGQRSRDAPGETAREGDQPGAYGLEQLPVDAWAVVVALEVAERAELDQVAVAALSAASSVRWAVPLCCALRSSTT